MSANLIECMGDVVPEISFFGGSYSTCYNGAANYYSICNGDVTQLAIELHLQLGCFYHSHQNSGLNLYASINT